MATAPELIRLCYVSEARLPPGGDPADEIARILVRSREGNRRAGITGALFFNRTMFAQVLEGHRADVDRLFDQIRTDRRHCRVIRLDWRGIEERAFPQWSMAFVGCSRADSSRYASLALSERRAAELARDNMAGLLIGIVRNREWSSPSDTARIEGIVEALAVAH